MRKCNICGADITKGNKTKYCSVLCSERGSYMSYNKRRPEVTQKPKKVYNSVYFDWRDYVGGVI